MSKEPTPIVGIDLGTTHCVVAYTDADLPEHQDPEVHLLPIPQVVAPGEVQPQSLLPSFLFMPGPHDVPEDSLRLPWGNEIVAFGFLTYQRDSNTRVRQ